MCVCVCVSVRGFAWSRVARALGLATHRCIILVLARLRDARRRRFVALQERRLGASAPVEGQIAAHDSDAGAPNETHVRRQSECGQACGQSERGHRRTAHNHVDERGRVAAQPPRKIAAGSSTDSAVLAHGVLQDRGCILLFVPQQHVVGRKEEGDVGPKSLACTRRKDLLHSLHSCSTRTHARTHAHTHPPTHAHPGTATGYTRMLSPVHRRTRATPVA